MPGQSPGSAAPDGGSTEEPQQQQQHKGLDQQLWQACAGSMVQLPSVGSRIIYFPQGHGEQAASQPDFPRSFGPYGAIPCRVLSVKFLADKETDEVFSRIRLQPESGGAALGEAADENHLPGGATAAERPASFAKTLTQSDANNGGGFSVPRYCAETIFPKLDYTLDPPVQTVHAKDVHGESWKFRHIYRGTPRRHLLTTGWSTFVNQKKLVAGDAIVFLRTSSGELCVGVRRSMRGAGNGDALLWHHSSGTRSSSRWDAHAQNSYSSDDTSFSNGSSKSGSGACFARNRSRVTSKSVLDAATCAAAGKAFEVVYYPRASTAEFCVKAITVKSSLAHAWYAGMRFKMAFETEDSFRISWFMGTVSAVQPADPALWPLSPWRVLQVAWDEPDLMHGLSRVSPWQVELISTLPMQMPPFSLPKKKFRVSQPFGHQQQQQQQQQGSCGGHSVGFPGSPALGQMNSWHCLSDEVPAGMQGARHERLYGLTFSDCQPGKVQAGLLDKFQSQDQGSAAALLNYGGQDLRLGNVLLFDRLQQQQQQQQQLFSNATSIGNRSQNSSASINSGCSNRQQQQQPQEQQQRQRQQQQQGGGTILLFGKTINACRPPDDDEHQQQQHQQPQPQQQQHSGGSSTEATSQQSSLRQDNNANNSNNSKNTNEDGNGNRAALSLSSSAEEVEQQQQHQQQQQQHQQQPQQQQAWLEAAGEWCCCKVFVEGEDVGRTVELWRLRSYEELYAQLGSMFSIDRRKLSGRVVYKDSQGSTIHVGTQPFTSFTKSVRRLTILDDARL